MKKFKYRLEALKKVREHVEKERQKALAASQHKVLDQEARLSDLEKKRLATFETQRQESQGSFSVAEMLVISRYLHKIKADSLMGGELLKVLKRDVENKRKELLEAAREHKKFKHLKEKQKEAFEKEINSLINKDSDETAVTTYRRVNKK